MCIALFLPNWTRCDCSTCDACSPLASGTGSEGSRDVHHQTHHTSPHSWAVAAVTTTTYLPYDAYVWRHACLFLFHRPGDLSANTFQTNHSSPHQSRSRENLLKLRIPPHHRHHHRRLCSTVCVGTFSTTDDRSSRSLHCPVDHRPLSSSTGCSGQRTI